MSSQTQPRHKARKCLKRVPAANAKQNETLFCAAERASGVLWRYDAQALRKERAKRKRKSAKIDLRAVAIRDAGESTNQRAGESRDECLKAASAYAPRCGVPEHCKEDGG